MSQVHGTTDAAQVGNHVEPGFEAADMALDRAGAIVSTLLAVGKLNDDTVRNALWSVHDLVRQAHLAIAAHAGRQ